METLHLATALVTLVVLQVAFLSVSPNPRPSYPGATTLSTSLGDVTGGRELVGETAVEVFYAIPFAKPPVGERRFRAPERADSWSPETLDGTVKPPACWQTIDTAFDRFEGVEMWNPNTARDEDCLYLNVWRPAATKTDAPTTIMVWIFGGGFWSGSAVLDLYDGSQLAARENVVVVTIAYRLGPLGFMYLDNNREVTGNAGLLDQVMALQWVKDNAIILGGSPDDITIFGESAGAASVGFHLLSPLSRDLFTNAIMQSASPLSYWAVKDIPQTVARVATLAANVSCPVSLGTNLLSCLREVDAQVLTEQQWILADRWFDVPIGPVVDGVFLPQHPEDLIKAGNIKKTKVITGVVKNEGIYWDIYGFPDAFPIEQKGQMNRDQFQSTMYTLSNDNSRFKEQLTALYSEEFSGPKRYMDMIDAASGDSLFKCSVVDFAREYTQAGGQVYLYSFEENFSSNPWPDWMGVPHGYEIEAMFGNPLREGSNNTQEEKELTKVVMDLWAKFATNRSPESKALTWPKYSGEMEEYVRIDRHGLQTLHGLRREACKLWATQNPSGW